MELDVNGYAMEMSKLTLGCLSIDEYAVYYGYSEFRKIEIRLDDFHCQGEGYFISRIVSPSAYYLVNDLDGVFGTFFYEDIAELFYYIRKLVDFLKATDIKKDVRLRFRKGQFSVGETSMYDHLLDLEYTPFEFDKSKIIRTKEDSDFLHFL